MEETLLLVKGYCETDYERRKTQNCPTHTQMSSYSTKLNRRRELLNKISQLEKEARTERDLRKDLENEIANHKAYLSMKIQSDQKNHHDPISLSLSREFNDTYIPRASTELTKAATAYKRQSPSTRDLETRATRTRTELTLEEEMIYNSTNVIRGEQKN